MLSNITIQERQAGLKDTRKQCLVIEYFSVYPKPCVGLTCPTPPPPGSFFTLTCAMGKLKPTDIFQTGIFTSLLYNPVTLAAFKPRACACALVRVCGRSKSSPNSKSVQPAARFKQQLEAGSRPISTELSSDWTCCSVTFQVTRGGAFIYQSKQDADAMFNWETFRSSVIHWKTSMLTKWELV